MGRQTSNTLVARVVSPAQRERHDYEALNGDLEEVHQRMARFGDVVSYVLFKSLRRAVVVFEDVQTAQFARDALHTSTLTRGSLLLVAFGEVRRLPRHGHRSGINANTEHAARPALVVAACTTAKPKVVLHLATAIAATRLGALHRAATRCQCYPAGHDARADGDAAAVPRGDGRPQRPAQHCHRGRRLYGVAATTYHCGWRQRRRRQHVYRHQTRAKVADTANKAAPFVALTL